MSESSNLLEGIENKIRAGMVNAFFGVLAMLVRPLATLTEVFFRRKMGERYFTPWNLTGGLLLLCAASFLNSLLASPPPQSGGGYDMYGNYHPPVTRQTSELYSTNNIVGFSWAASWAFLGSLNFIAVTSRYKRNQRWHSYCPGVSMIPFMPVIIERAIPLAGAIILFKVGCRGYGLLMFASGITTIFLRRHEEGLFFNRLLDVIDAQIEADNLSKAVRGSLPAQKVEGLSVTVPAAMSPDFRERFLAVAQPAQTPSPQIVVPPTAANAFHGHVATSMTGQTA